jgi:hypothetical protein
MAGLQIENNDKIEEITGQNVEEITGDLKLFSLYALKRLNFPKLKRVNAFHTYGVPLLSELTENWTSGEGITITNNNKPDGSVGNKLDIRNSGLKSLVFNFAANGTYSGGIKINDNTNLTSLTIKGLLHAPQISISENGVEGTRPAIEFPSMKTSQTLDIMHASSVDVRKLETVDGRFEISRGSFTELLIPNLKSVNREIAISYNNDMQKLDLSALERVGPSENFGQLRIDQNPSLKSWVAPPNYQWAGRGTWLSGHFEK